MRKSSLLSSRDRTGSSQEIREPWRRGARDPEFRKKMTLHNNFKNIFSLPAEEIVSLYSRNRGGEVSSECASELLLQVGEILTQVKDRELSSLLAHYGLDVIYMEYAYDFPSHIYRAEVSVEEKKIVIFRPLLLELEQAVVEILGENVIPCSLAEILIVHELYHYLEYSEKKRREEPAIWQEIRAHLFTWRYLSLPFYPGILDMVHSAYREKKKLVHHTGENFHG